MSAEAARLREVFKEVDLPEIEGVEFKTMSHADIANLLPPFGGNHPTKAILIDTKTGRAYGLASGWEAVTVNHNGIQFKSGAVTAGMAWEAAGSWKSLGNHTEAVAAAFMRKNGITDVLLYINARNPCWGTPDGTGCYYRMPELLEEGSTMKIYNKYGSNVISAWPERKFDFTGLPD